MSVAPGDSVKCQTQAPPGDGDVDLHMKFGSLPDPQASVGGNYDCRSAGSTSSETCEDIVPAGETTVFISVTNFVSTSLGNAQNVDLTCYRNCDAGEFQFNFAIRPDRYSNVDNSHRLLDGSGNTVYSSSVGDFVYDANNQNNVFMVRTCLTPGDYTFFLG